MVQPKHYLWPGAEVPPRSIMAKQHIAEDSRGASSKPNPRVPTFLKNLAVQSVALGAFAPLGLYYSGPHLPAVGIRSFLEYENEVTLNVKDAEEFADEYVCFSCKGRFVTRTQIRIYAHFRAKSATDGLNEAKILCLCLRARSRCPHISSLGIPSRRKAASTAFSLIGRSLVRRPGKT